MATPPKNHPITPKSEDFGEILHGGYPFRVPRYQRAYDWDKDEVRDWARDLAALAKHRLANQARRHFFGAIISVAVDADKTYEVVDGQQRLTTEMVSLCELKARYESLAASATAAGKPKPAAEASKAAKAVQACLQTSAGLPKLTLSQRDKQFFMDILAGTAVKPKRGADESHRRLWQARELLQEELFDEVLKGAATHAEQLKRLDAIHAALVEDGYLVHLFTSDAQDAFQVFMILNDRGRPLSTGSLLRTHTLAVLESFSTQQSGAEADWDALLTAGDRIVDAFLTAYYVSWQEDRPMKGELFRSFRDTFLVEAVSSAAKASTLRKTISELREEMATFRALKAGDWPYPTTAVASWERDRLRRLTISLRHELANPLLLAAAQTVDEKAFRTLVLLLEPFVFRYINIVGASPTALQHVYYRHAKKTRGDGKLDMNGLRNDLKKLMAQRAPDDLFAISLREQLRFTGDSQRKALIRHFLTTLEDYEAWYQGGANGPPKVKDKTKVFDLDDGVNIEHIYPQNPQVPDPALVSLTHALGNLTALDQVHGAKIGNADFPAKAPEYARSSFTITQPLAALSAWNPTELQVRLDYYTERAKKIFVVR